MIASGTVSVSKTEPGLQSCALFIEKREISPLRPGVILKPVDYTVVYEVRLCDLVREMINRSDENMERVGFTQVVQH